MRQKWLAALVCGSCGTFAAEAGAQSLGDPPVIQGMGPYSAGSSRYAPKQRQPRQPYGTTVPAPMQTRSDEGGGLFGYLFGERQRGYTARYNGPAQSQAYYAYRAQPAYGYQRRSAAYSYEPDGTEAPRRSPDARFMRQEVAYDGPQPAGTVVIDTPNKFLYLVQGQGRAIRYGIGVGRPGFTWSGVKTISRKAEWPAWTPPPEMLLRRPDLPTHMEGGPGNPLGARAMYLGSSMYRIHGTTEPETIGTNVSSGCIRLINEDVIDLYQRVRVGTRVIVL